MEELPDVDRLSHAQKDDLIGALLAPTVAALGEALKTVPVAHYQSAHDRILAAGEAANPRAPPSGKRSRTRQSKVLNLIDRLRVHADDVWRFTINHNVPFSNNIAEQAMRIPKVKQKISGGFRTQAGLDTFCTIRPYLATPHKQGANLFHALTLPPL